MRVSVIDNTASNSISAGILGTVSSKELLSNINNKLKSYSNNITFESMQNIIQKGKEFFVKNIVKPYQNINEKINSALNIFDKDQNIIKPLISKEDYLKIPPKMINPIMYYKPMRDLFLEDRIFGFDIDKEKLIDVKSDRIRQLINNGKCYNIIDKVKADKNNKNKNIVVRHVSVYKSDDIDYSLEDLDMIEQTRLYIDKLIRDHIDPSDIENSIG